MWSPTCALSRNSSIEKAMTFRSVTRAAAALGGVALLLAGSSVVPFTTNQKAFYADAGWVAFVRPGLVVTITSAEIAPDGTISVGFSLTDPKGAPLDRNGVGTPGPVSLNFIAAYIPQKQQQ